MKIKMKHEDKLRLARKLSGRQKGSFQSPAWETRKSRIESRVEFEEEVAMQRRIQKNLEQGKGENDKTQLSQL